jgi:hypothetical protein
MTGDKKGKGKAVEKPKRKRTHEERESDRALAVPDTQGQPQRPVCIRETPADTQGELGSGAAAETISATVAAQGTRRYAAQGVRVLQQQQLHHHHLTILVLVPVVELLRG